MFSNEKRIAFPSNKVFYNMMLYMVHCLIMHLYNLRFRINAFPTWLTGVKYDAEKEEKYLQDNKQKELARIEEALQKAAEKGTELIMQISIGISGLRLCSERKVLVSN